MIFRVRMADCCSAVDVVREKAKRGSAFKEPVLLNKRKRCLDYTCRYSLSPSMAMSSREEKEVVAS